MNPETPPQTTDAALILYRPLWYGGTEPYAPSYWSYTDQDPYAITVTFDTYPPVSWVFARDIAYKGLRQNSGLGWVQMKPYRHPLHFHDSGRWVEMRLLNPPDTTTLLVPKIPLGIFMQDALDIVPFGKESDIQLPQVEAAIRRIHE